MIYDPQLLDQLQELEPRRWKGQVYRYMFGDIHPARPNTRGARWNPPGIGAIYTALEPETLKAELEYRLSLDPVRPRIAPNFYTIDLRLVKVLDLSSHDQLRALGLSEEQLVETDFVACQKIGGSVAWLEHDGLLVPSARRSGTNLVVYPKSCGPDCRFEVINSDHSRTLHRC